MPEIYSNIFHNKNISKVLHINEISYKRGIYFIFFFKLYKTLKVLVCYFSMKNNSGRWNKFSALCHIFLDEYKNERIGENEIHKIVFFTFRNLNAQVKVLK